jgi:hypothetical protein
MFQPNVAIIRFENMVEVNAFGQSHIYSLMLSQLVETTSRNEYVNKLSNITA